jgi:hypothetical protein
VAPVGPVMPVLPVAPGGPAKLKDTINGVLFVIGDASGLTLLILIV